jgi:protein-disulfide isomerase
LNLRSRSARLVAVVIVALIIVVVAVVLSSSSGGPSGLRHGRVAQTETTAVARLLSGIPQSGTQLGSPSAPITLLYFGDLECPACRAFTLDAGLPKLIANQVRRGQVKVEYHSFCTATCDGPGVSVFDTQQVAAYAAGLQDRFWDYAELFYREQGAEDSGYVTPSFLDGLARQTPGLNIKAWQVQRGTRSLLSDIETDSKIEAELKLQSTPTLIMQGPKRTLEVPGGIPTYADLAATIAQVQ